jgi:hypothetical protein
MSATVTREATQATTRDSEPGWAPQVTGGIPRVRLTTGIFAAGRA